MTRLSPDYDPADDDGTLSAEVRLLGRVDMPSLLALQKLMVHEVRLQSRVGASILLCEHPPSITVGTDSSLLDLPTDRRELDAKLLKVHRVRRDGGTVLHQPGRIAAYVVISLTEAGFGPAEFRYRLQEAVIRCCREFQVKVTRRSGDDSVLTGRHGIVCELGIRIEDDVTDFGLVLNVSNRLDEARTIGRGLRGERISSMNAERVRPTIPAAVRTALIGHLCEQIGYPQYHVHTGHPFLVRTRKLVHDSFTDH